MKAKPIFKSLEGERVIISFYESILLQWPVPKEIMNVDTCLGLTHIIACGDITSPAMILLHGSSTNSAIWFSDVAEYSKNFRVFAVDIPGEPGKSAKNRPLLKSNGYAEWLNDLYEKLKIKKAVIIGISLGGCIAAQFAIQNYEKVDKLILLCPGGITQVRITFLMRLLALSIFGKWGAKAIKKAIFRDVQIPKEVEDFNQLIQKHYNPRIEATPVFKDHELKSLLMPVFLVAGEKDIIFDSWKTANRMKKYLPDFYYVVLPDTGHALVNTLPHVKEFLNGTS